MKKQIENTENKLNNLLWQHRLRIETLFIQLKDSEEEEEYEECINILEKIKSITSETKEEIETLYNINGKVDVTKALATINEEIKLFITEEN